MKKMTAQEIKDAVDELGNVRAKLSVLQLREAALKNALEGSLKLGSITNGERFFVVYTEKPYRTVDAAKVMKAIGPAKFLMVASVSVSKLDDVAPSIAAKLAVNDPRPTLTVKVLPE